MSRRKNSQVFPPRGKLVKFGSAVKARRRRPDEPLLKLREKRDGQVFTPWDESSEPMILSGGDLDDQVTNGICEHVELEIVWGWGGTFVVPSLNMPIGPRD